MGEKITATIKKESLKKIELLSKINSRTNLEALDYVMIDFKEKTITKTNLDQTLIMDIEAESTEDIQICIKMGFLTRLAKELAGNDINMEIEENVIKDINKLYKNVSLLDINQFPEMKFPEKFKPVATVNSDDMKKLLSLIEFNKQEWGPVRSVLFKDNRMLTTDGIAISTINCLIKNEALIPMDAFKIANSMGDSEYSVDIEDSKEPNIAKISLDGITLYSRVLAMASTFPNVSSVLDISQHKFFGLDKEDIVKAIRQTMPTTFDNEGYITVLFTLLEDKISMSASSVSNNGEVEIEIPAKLPELSCEGNKFGLNQKKIFTALSLCDETCEIGLTNVDALSKHIVFVREGNFMAGIMPVTI